MSPRVLQLLAIQRECCPDESDRLEDLPEVDEDDEYERMRDEEEA